MNNIYMHKLTPAAQKTLDEILDEYKNQIINNAYNSASINFGDVDEITVLDIINALQNTDLRIKRSINKNKYFDRIFITIISLLSVIFSAFAFYTTNKTEVSQQLLTIIVLLIGTLVGFLFTFELKSLGGKFQKIKIDDNDFTKFEPFEIVKKWTEIEILIKEIVAYKFGESNTSNSPMAMINMLIKLNVLSNDDIAKLSNILKVRNEIVHKNLILSPKEIKENIDFSDTLIDKLRPFSIK